jgi:hypothetical protein
MQVASSSRSQVQTRAASAEASLTWDGPSVGVRWHPPLSVAIVTHFVTCEPVVSGCCPTRFPCLRAACHYSVRDAHADLVCDRWDVADTDQQQSKIPLLTTALDHAWRWYDIRISSGLQILNFYLLAMAVLTTAYVSGLNARNHVVSVAVALAAAAVTVSTYTVGARQDHVARLALVPIQEVENRLADELNIGSLRLVEQYRVRHRLSTYAARGIAHFIYPLIIAVCVAAAIYAAVTK